MSRRRTLAAVAFVALLGPLMSPQSGARADEQDAERRDNLIALLMVEESVRICSFAIDEGRRAQLAAVRAGLADKLLLDATAIDRLRANLDQQFQVDRVAYCAPDGPWKKAVDETLDHLPAM